MKKVRVIKEIPFIRVGKIIELNPDDGIGYKNTSLRYSWDKVELLVEDGWLEYVEEEKSLVMQVHDILRTFPEGSKGSLACALEIKRFMHDHYKERFDKVVDNVVTADELYVSEHIRKALFGGSNET